MGRYLSSESVDEMVRLYLQEGFNTVEIGEMFDVCNSSVGRNLKKRGIDVSLVGNLRKRKASAEDELAICNMYKNGHTMAEIRNTYELSDLTMSMILRRNNIKTRDAMRRSVISNHNYFDQIDTVAKAYFLGWMISDGSIIRSKSRKNRSNVISLEIQSSDVKILQLFCKEIGASEDIIGKSTRIERNKKDTKHVRFASNKMSESLSKYGVIPNKSKVTYLPTISHNLMPHLIRGIFDGDGTAYIYKNKYIRFGFYGSIQICLDILDYLHKTIGLNKNGIYKMQHCFLISWQGEDAANRFSQYIYNQDCGDFYLDRKKEILYNYIK